MPYEGIDWAELPTHSLAFGAAASRMGLKFQSHSHAPIDLQLPGQERLLGTSFSVDIEKYNVHCADGPCACCTVDPDINHLALIEANTIRIDGAMRMTLGPCKGPSLKDPCANKTSLQTHILSD